MKTYYPVSSVIDFSGTKKIFKALPAAVLLQVCITIFGVGSVLGVDINNEPMETQIKTAPANIMFVLDNSGSMDWEYMTPEQDGKFDNETALFSGLSSSQKLMWKGRWSGYNTIYYNTHSIYRPWSRWERMDSTEDASGVQIADGGTPPPPNADIINPRQNPIDSGSTFNLNNVFYSALPLGDTTVTVDNRNAAPAFTTTGTWTESSLTPEWDGSALYSSTVNGAATFTPLIPAADEYQVFAWWNCYTGRDMNALVELDFDGDNVVDVSERWNQRATSDNTPEPGVCGEWLELFGGVSFSFTAGRHGSVSIKHDAHSTPGTNTVADAIRFVPTSKTMDVRNAHYYVVDDNNENGVAEPGEIYLVNFSWTDSDSDTEVDENEVKREYYLVSDNNGSNNHEVVQYVQPVYYDPADPENDAVPDSIQAGIYNAYGDFIGYVSDYEDLQNFANWYSFYRKRDLTAKAAVSLSSVDLYGVNIGYYTINSGVRVAAQPMNELIDKVDSNRVVVDNRDNAFSRDTSRVEVCTRWRRGSCRRWEWVSAWEETSRRVDDDYGRSGLYTESTGAWATWTPNIPVTGSTKVSAWWACEDQADQKARFTIEHAGGTTVLYINQRASRDGRDTSKADCTDPSGDGCCNEWVNLGTYNFNQGRSGSVTVERHAGSTEDYTMADAVMFESSTGVTVNSTDMLLDQLYSVNPSGYTPLRRGLKSVGQYFDQDDGVDGISGAPNPYYSEADGGSCQQAYAIAMTDGYWNGNNPGVGNADNNTGAPYEDNVSDTLADVAMYYYNRDLAVNLLDELPTNNYDKRKTQHMVTFSVSFGLSGSIPLDDINLDGDPDDPGYFDDPYFLDPDTPSPVWPNPFNNCSACPKKIDDLWHASVNGHGRFFQANDPDSLVNSLSTLFKDIGARNASGASVSVNGDELSTGLVLYQSTYSSGSWVGDVLAYPIDPNTGEIHKTEDKILWSAQDKLQLKDWDVDRKIITYTGTPGIGTPFRYGDLGPVQQKALENDPNAVEYIRGREVDGFRARTKKLGDIVHSAPLLTGKSVPAHTDGIDNDADGLVDEDGERKGGTIFVGGNDGMLHALDAQTGEERFAYIPLHAFPYLYELTKEDFNHRFYVDSTAYAAPMSFFSGDRTDDGIDNDKDGQTDEPDENYGDGIDNDNDGLVDEPSEDIEINMLVGALKKGGRGIYALNITNIEDDTLPQTEFTLASGPTSIVRWEYPPVPATGLEFTYAGDQTADGIDNDGDGYFDSDLNEADNGDNEDYSDSVDNDGDGLIDEEGEMAMLFDDNDMGYSFSDPFMARSYKSFNEALDYNDNPWVVVFGNGYESINGHAVLYVLDAWSGDLIRKIDTGSGSNNGLSTPALVDVDNDRRVDYVYAGDLNGNMWKFDLTDPDPENWGVAFGDDNANHGNDRRIDYADVDSSTGEHDIPKPLFSAPGQPITSAPDVMYHCEANGYMVIFGTGKFLGESDRDDTSQQSVFGIWDFDDKDYHNAANYLGEWDRNTNTFDNGTFTGVKLLEQVEVDWRQSGDHWLRTLSDNSPNWYRQCDDGIDNDGDLAIDESEEDDPASPERCIPVAPAFYASDLADNDGDETIDEADEATGHAGWFFDLPFTDLSTDGIDNDGDGDPDNSGEGQLVGERVIKDVIIRNGKAIVISLIPESSPCTGGGRSIIHEMEACDGSRASRPTFDINGDGRIDDQDMIDIGLVDPDGNPVHVPPTGLMFEGMLHTPVIVKDPDDDREVKIFSSSAGTTETVWERKEKTGFYYWRDR